MAKITDVQQENYRQTVKFIPIGSIMKDDVGYAGLNPLKQFFPILH